MGVLDFLKAEPADELIRQVSPAELGKRSLVEIINSETGQVLGQLHKGQDIQIGAGMPGHAGIELADFYDAARLVTVSHVHCEFAFTNDGSVVYSDLNSIGGSVVERKNQSALSMGLPLPRLDFNIRHNVTSAYLTRNAISRAAEPRNLPEHVVPPNGVRLKHKDNVYLGFVYGLAVPTGLGRLVAGGGHKLQLPAAIVNDGQIMAPRLAVYIR